MRPQCCAHRVRLRTCERRQSNRERITVALLTTRGRLSTSRLCSATTHVLGWELRLTSGYQGTTVEGVAWGCDSTIDRVSRPSPRVIERKQSGPRLLVSHAAYPHSNALHIFEHLGSVFDGPCVPHEGQRTYVRICFPCEVIRYGEPSLPQSGNQTSLLVAVARLTIDLWRNESSNPYGSLAGVDRFAGQASVSPSLNRSRFQRIPPRSSSVCYQCRRYRLPFRLDR